MTHIHVLTYESPKKKLHYKFRVCSEHVVAFRATKAEWRNRTSGAPYREISDEQIPNDGHLIPCAVCGLRWRFKGVK